jgi:ABC-type dipeptide/oligopeptide/nickel transport system ATPase subunit
VIVRLRNVSKSYDKPVPVHALKNITASLPKTKRLMIVGESGSGKTTLAKCLAGWESPDQGSIELFCRAPPQLVPQEPATSLNPHWTALEIVAEPYRIGGVTKAESQRLSASWLDRMELPANYRSRACTAFSGGEQARLAIARALAAMNPGKPGASTDRSGLLMFDESFSALDEPLRIRLLDLLSSLQTELPVMYLFLSHDIVVTGGFVDSVVVMAGGQIVEQGSASEVLSSPTSEAMQRILADSKDFT